MRFDQMVFNRIEAKMAARESMRLTRPSPLLVTLVYFLLTSMLMTFIGMLFYSPVSDAMGLLRYGYKPEEIVPYILQEHSSELLIYGVAQLVFWLYHSLMGFGYTSYTLRMARNEQPSFRNLFDGFLRPGRALGAAFLTELFTALWTLLYSLPVIALTVVAALVNPLLVSSLYGLTMAVIVVSAVVVSLRYALIYYFLLDDPGCTVLQAIRLSKETMRGRKGQLFMAYLSFFGWAVLSSILGYMIAWTFSLGVVVNVLAFWIMPYMGATEANFYDWATGASQPSGSPAGPEYDYRANDEIKPF